MQLLSEWDNIYYTMVYNTYKHNGVEWSWFGRVVMRLRLHILYSFSDTWLGWESGIQVHKYCNCLRIWNVLLLKLFLFHPFDIFIFHYIHWGMEKGCWHLMRRQKKCEFFYLEYWIVIYIFWKLKLAGIHSFSISIFFCASLTVAIKVFSNQPCTSNYVNDCWE